VFDLVLMDVRRGLKRGHSFDPSGFGNILLNILINLVLRINGYETTKTTLKTSNILKY